MKVATSLADVDASHQSVVSIGNFDGLHLGHQKILKTVVDRAKGSGIRSVAMTFSPHPMKVLAPQKPLLLISTEVVAYHGYHADLGEVARRQGKVCRGSRENVLHAAGGGSYIVECY